MKNKIRTSPELLQEIAAQQVEPLQEYNVQIWLCTQALSEQLDQRCLLSQRINEDNINKAKSYITKIVKEGMHVDLGDLYKFPGSRPPSKIKWKNWKGAQLMKNSKGREYYRIARESKFISSRIAPNKTYIRLIIMWYPPKR